MKIFAPTYLFTPFFRKQQQQQQQKKIQPNKKKTNKQKQKKDSNEDLDVLENLTKDFLCTLK